ncbi:hypothetical protein HDU82_008802 [Entophlyctis luteolus]|nr:hypothetical protein HDU82_008802 [Entophlyctis luteolus]
MRDDNHDVDILVKTLLARLVARGETIATAESVTGGLVSAALTAQAGASRAVRGGVVAYTDASKIAQLHVPAGIIERESAVSAACAAAMAQGGTCGDTCDADWCVATTGYAGPAPSSPPPPPPLSSAAGGVLPSLDGTVFVHVFGRNAGVSVGDRLTFDLAAHSRGDIRAKTVARVLQLALASIPLAAAERANGA